MLYAMAQETYQWVTIILLLVIALGIWFGTYTVRR